MIIVKLLNLVALNVINKFCEAQFYLEQKKKGFYK